MKVLGLLAAFSMLLSGCSPAVYLNLYNATGDTITVIKGASRQPITIQPNTAADIELHYQPGEHVLIRSSRYNWTYSPPSLFPPQSLCQQHMMVMRAFARIDNRGEIYGAAPTGIAATRVPSEAPEDP